MDGIVVGVDRSAAAVGALEWALAEGVRRGTKVTAVTAWTDLATAGYPLGGVLVTDPTRVEALALETAEELLKEATAKVPGTDGIETASVALRGPAAAVLAELSRTADLVVVGTRSASALSRAVLGSVSSSLLHHAASPVVVVPEPRPAGDRTPRVVVGVDHSPASKVALQWAADVAARRDMVLMPVFVREAAFPETQSDYSLADLEDHERAALRSAVGTFEGSVVPEVLSGHAGEQLLDMVEPQDLLVVGSRGRGGFTGLLLGSTSTSVAQHAVCPVAVLRAGVSA